MRRNEPPNLLYNNSHSSYLGDLHDTMDGMIGILTACNIHNVDILLDHTENIENGQMLSL
jgi:hypothetical protein